MSTLFFDSTNNLLAQTLEQLIKKEKNLSASSLAEKLDMPRNKITRILNGDVNDPKASTLTPIANYFGVTIDELLGVKPLSNGIVHSRDQTLLMERPFVSQDKIIDWINNNYEPSSFYEIAIKDNEPFENSFISKIDSDALSPIISPSMFLIIGKNYPLQAGDFVVASDNKSLLLRKIQMEGNDWYLSAINPVYKTIKKEKPFFIIGKILDARLFLT
jgi:transcriptional regulator with XRE-family HTH domain